MSEPIPDVTAATALVDLITMLHTDPLARPLLDGSMGPMYFVRSHGGLSVRLRNPAKGNEQLAAAQALFGGELTPGSSHSPDVEEYLLTSTWQAVPLRLYVEVDREDELAELRKQVADLRAAQAATATGQDVAE